MTIAEAWNALQTAMETTAPSCAGEPEFTTDDLSAAEVEWCAAICRTCPLLELCSDYAAAARPTAGFWAGRPRRGGQS